MLRLEWSGLVDRYINIKHTSMGGGERTFESKVYSTRYQYIEPNTSAA